MGYVIPRAHLLFQHYPKNGSGILSFLVHLHNIFGCFYHLGNQTDQGWLKHRGRSRGPATTGTLNIVLIITRLTKLALSKIPAVMPAIYAAQFS